MSERVLVDDRTHEQAGFTLVELLVVIGIIGVLATLLGPTVAGMRSRAIDLVLHVGKRR